jgi:hypothetical protein
MELELEQVLTSWGKNAVTEAQQEALRGYLARGGRYPHAFMVDAFVYLDELNKHAPDGWRLTFLTWGRGADNLPAGSFRIGQMRLRSGDPECPIYMCPCAVASIRRDEVADELAANYEDACYEDEGEAAYGRED